MLRVLSLLFRARAILALWLAGLLLLGIAVVNIANRTPFGDVAPPLGIAGVLLASATFLTRRAFAKDVRGRRGWAKEWARARSMKTDAGEGLRERCETCAAVNDDDAAFCTKCGGFLDRLRPAS